MDMTMALPVVQKLSVGTYSVTGDVRREAVDLASMLECVCLVGQSAETTRSLPPPRAQRKCGGKPDREASARLAGGDLTTDAGEESARFRRDFSVPPGLTESYS